MWAKLVSILSISASDALQLSEMRKSTPDASESSEGRLQRVWLNDEEVERRGSHCLDGSTPAYFLGEGSEDGKWLIFLNGGGYCTDEQNCFEKLPLHGIEETMERIPIQTHDAFANYNHVYVKNCDLGIYMGDRSEPVVYNGQKLYFQGARILKHVVDSLQSNFTMKEVLVSGGSGGGHSLYAVADYLKGLMPSSVTKFAVAPINGWYVSSEDYALSSMYALLAPEATISESCKAAFSSNERYKCLDPVTAYRYTQTTMFMTQIFDHTFSNTEGSNDKVKDAYYNCLSTEFAATGPCDGESVELLQGFLDNYTQSLTTYPKYSENGQGGYLSTCTKHAFYGDSDVFFEYANNGVTVGDAISKWWESIGTNPPAVWYLPCTLGTAPNPQCESTCACTR